MKCEPAQTAAADLLPNECHATANISLLARLQKLPTATLSTNRCNSHFSLHESETFLKTLVGIDGDTRLVQQPAFKQLLFFLHKALELQYYNLSFIFLFHNNASSGHMQTKAIPLVAILEICMCTSTSLHTCSLVICSSEAAEAEWWEAQWFLLLPLGCCLHKSDLCLGNYVFEHTNLRWFLMSLKAAHWPTTKRHQGKHSQQE